MKKIVSITTLILLLFNSTGALYGGWLLITDPSGTTLEISPAVLVHTPFPDFLVPGVALFAINGILSLVVAMAILTKTHQASLLVCLQGFLLTGWIVIQYFWTQVYHPLQAVMGTAGLILICCGFFLLHLQKKDELHLQQMLENQSFMHN